MPASELGQVQAGEGVDIHEVVRAYVDAFSRGDLDAISATFAPDGTYTDPVTTQPVVGGQAIKEQFAGFFAGFPDATFETVSLDPLSARLFRMALGLAWDQHRLLSRSPVDWSLSETGRL